LALQVEGQRIDNKTSTFKIPNLSEILRQKLVDRRFTSFGSLKKSCRANDGAFKSLLISLGAKPEEVAFLVSIIRQGQTIPPSPPQPSA
jgi:hypothetical protein